MILYLDKALIFKREASILFTVIVCHGQNDFLIEFQGVGGARDSLGGGIQAVEMTHAKALWPNRALGL